MGNLQICSNTEVHQTFVIIVDKRKKAIEIKDAEDLRRKLQEANGKLVVIDFMTNWCDNSKIMEPKLDEIAMEMSDNVVVYKVDVDACQDIAAQYNINSIPTYVFVKNEKKIEEFSGANLERLVSAVQKHK